jgi:glycerol-3-phosphate dehydrogenase
LIARDLDAMQAGTYDLLVVGGGIYGVALLLSAARRGLKVALVEQADYGAATSWNSLRILHGGLRYLQTLDLRRFLQSVRERRRFARVFPALVERLPCLMPLYRSGLKRRSVFAAALALNDLGSLHRNRGVAPHLRIPRGRTLGVEATLRACPLVRRDGLEGAACWTDYRMLSSERILIEMLAWACDEGASAANYVRAEGLLTESGEVRGLVARDLVANTDVRLAAKVVINCGGPLAGPLARRWHREIDALERPSLAFNLLLDRPLPGEHALAVGPAGAGAPVLFLAPQGATTFVGTGHLPRPRGTTEAVPTEAEIATFLAQLSAGMPGWGVGVGDVRRVFAGLLPAVEAGSAVLSKREVLLDHATEGGPRGLYSISGVKFTTSWDVAEQVLELASPRLPPMRQAVEPPERRTLSAVTPLLTGQIRAVPPAQQLDEQLRGVAASEAVRQADDLLLRRTNWGVRLPDTEDMRRSTERILQS